MNYHVTVYTNEILIEVRIAYDPRPGRSYIAARKLRVTPTGIIHFPPATVRVNIGFNSDLFPEEVEHLQRWLTEASSVARQLDEEVIEPSDFTEAVRYEVREVAGELILDKIEPLYQQKPVEEWQEGRREE